MLECLLNRRRYIGKQSSSQAKKNRKCDVCVGNLSLRFEEIGHKDEKLGGIRYLERMANIKGYPLGILAFKISELHEYINGTGETYTMGHRRRYDSTRERQSATQHRTP